MFSIGLLALTLWGDILAEPFRIAEAEPGHHQVYLQAAMAPDGRFAIMWRDSLPINNHHNSELELFVRFFDRDGNPLADPYKITKLADTNYIYGPCLDMDTLGNTVLVWSEGGRYLENTHTRFQVFAPDGSPMDSARIMCSGGAGWYSRLGLSIANNGEFAVVCPTRFPERGYGLWVQRFDLEGVPKDSAFLAHDTGDISCRYTQVALNDAGDLVVTWLDFRISGETYPRFQVFDAEDEPILGWEPMGHRVDDGEELYNGTRSEVYWLDEDRFVVFWIDGRTGYPEPSHPAGRVFSDRGLTRHPIRWLIWRDSLWLYHGGPEGYYSTAVSPDDSFAYTHTRSHSDYPDTSDPSKKRYWEHGVGILGYIQDNEPIRWTNLFEYTPPLGKDTINSTIDNWPHVQPSAVACSNERLVWVYSRLNTDTIFEAFAMITDWDMGIGVAEQPIVRITSDWEVVTSIGPQIVLRYQDRPDGFRASIFDASGRKVDELKSPAQNGALTWGEGYGAGVYFIRIEGDASATTHKVILIH